MARMSIDDMFLRDPRVERLARDIGWSKFEARGRLLGVFAVAYDRVDADKGDLLDLQDIDIAAEFEGFGLLMIKHDLAVNLRNRIRIRGAQERTVYLSTRETSGRIGGIKSGESRRNKAKVTFEANGRSPSQKHEGPANPSAPDPASASASAPDLVPDPSSVLKSRTPPAAAARNHALPDGWKPSDSEANRIAEASARSRGVDLVLEMERMRDWSRANGSRGKKTDWDATWRNWMRSAKRSDSNKPQAGFDAVLAIARGESP